jgi:hypothetical protein
LKINIYKLYKKQITIICYFQEQIFLHEDEDGQLYFKDDNGALQPVYLTDDGNYAIAETSDDTNKESKFQQNSNVIEEDTFILPDLDPKSSSNKQVLFYIRHYFR